MIRLIAFFGLTLALSLSAFGQQETPQQSPTTHAPSGNTPADQSAAKAPLKTMKGTVQTQGENVVFMDDSGKSWSVMNPEELRGHEGHHVQISAHVYADKDAIHVMHVKLTKGEAKTGEPMSK